jgi:3-keto-L-gulonate-6-phosphate decarboxylase
VLGVTQDKTVQGALGAARESGKQVMVDLMQVPDPVSRSRDLLAMGCHYLCVHTAYDLQTPGTTPLDALRRLRDALPDAPLAVAGGINLETIGAVIELVPQIVIVGGAIVTSPDPAHAAQAIRARMEAQ